MLRSLLSAMHVTGGGGDPYWANVVLLVANDNAANNSTTFADQSSVGRTMTTVSGAKYSSAQAPTGMTTSMLLNGTTDYITAADSADWDFGSGDFTVEGMVRWTAGGQYGTLAAQYASVTSDASWWATLPNISGDNNAYWEWTTNGVTNNFHTLSGWTAAIDTWYHVAFARSGSSLRFFVNGTQIGGTQTNSATIFNSTTALSIGHTGGSATFDMKGYMASVRITKGVARYTANFTPPSLPLPTS